MSELNLLLFIRDHNIEWLTKHLLRDLHHQVRITTLNGTEEWIALSRNFSAVFFQTEANYPGDTIAAVAADCDRHGVPLVFISAKKEDAFTAYEYGATDFLLFPWPPERLTKCLDRLEKNRTTRQLLQLLEANTSDVIAAQELQGKILIRSGSGYMPLPVTEIISIRGAADYVRIEATRGTFLHHSSMQGLLSRLSQATFVRIHRSVIVNAEKVALVASVGNGSYNIVMVNGTSFRSSRSRKLAVRQLLLMRKPAGKTS